MSTRRINDLLNLSYVVNWHNVPTARRQSVAEHSFRVAAIAMELCRRINGEQLPSRSVIEYDVLRWALVHDGPESETGDIPHTTKVLLPPGVWATVEVSMAPWYAREDCRVHPPERAIVKIADLMEQKMFIDSAWASQEGVAASQAIFNKLAEAIRVAEIKFGWGIGPVVIDIMKDARNASDTRHLSQTTNAKLEREVKADSGDLNPSNADPGTV